MQRLGNLVAAAVALLIAVGGIAYGVARPVEWDSEARLLLSPAPADDEQLPNLLDGFDQSGVAGTYVELLASGELARRSEATTVDITARWIPDTRVITVTANGDEGAVQGALDRLIEEAQGEQDRLNDLWSASVLDPPTAPEKSGASLTLLVAASLLLGLLGGLFVLVLMRRFLPGSGDDGGGPVPPAARRESRRQRRAGRGAK